jgi:hypothetical protein
LFRWFPSTLAEENIILSRVERQRLFEQIAAEILGYGPLEPFLADETIKLIYQQKSVTPDRPFFVYFAPGATHGPHHVPKEWMDKFKGKFNQGWDKYRDETYQRQLKLGVIPPDTKLTPRPKEIPAYDSLTADRKRIVARLMEAFAAYTAQTDYEIGRILDALEQVLPPEREINLAAEYDGADGKVKWREAKAEKRQFHAGMV